MSEPTKEAVLAALRKVSFPGFRRDIVAAGVVREVRVGAGAIAVDLHLGQGDPAVAPRIEQAVREALATFEGDPAIRLRFASGPEGGELPIVGQTSRPSAAEVRDGRLLPGVRDIVAVASGKGGVGKSTVAVNLAVSLAKAGIRVGLLDADIYGPSIPLMFGLSDRRPQVDRDRRCIVPFERYGVRFMSLGFLVEQDTAVIWRGPMVMKALEQLMEDVDWGELDVLVVDMPPGTGDAQLTMSQRVRLSGAVIVTTPQDVALADAIKGVAMFRKVGVPVLGIVENMSYFACPHCGERTEIFGHGGGRSQAERLGTAFLGEIPIDPGIREGGDSGTPSAVAEGSALATAFDTVAGSVRGALERDSDGGPADDGGFFSRFRRESDGR